MGDAAARRGATRIAAELVRLVRARAATNAVVPRSIEDVDAGWLGGALHSPVDTVSTADVAAGTSVRGRLLLTGKDVPFSIFVKIAPARTGPRLVSNLADLAANECLFYRAVQPTVAVESPRPFFAVEDPRTKGFAIGLEDLRLRGCRFGQLEEPVAPDQAAAVLRALAQLHGAFWQSPRLSTDLAAVITNSSDPNASLVRGSLRLALRRLRRRQPSLVPPAGAFIGEHQREIVESLETATPTLLHGDPHLGNIYFDGDRAGLLDWQVLRQGDALRDVAYFLVLSLDPAVRRQHADELLERYRADLVAHGGPALDQAVAVEGYRSQAAYAYIAAVFTVGAGGLQPDRVALVGLQRAAAALQDLGTESALRRRLHEGRANASPSG